MTSINRLAAGAAIVFAVAPLPIVAAEGHVAAAAPALLAAPATTPSPTVTVSPSPTAVASPTVTVSPSPTAVASPTTTPSPSPETFVEVNPATGEPGTLIGIRASCPDNSAPATVESEAFGQVTVRPQFDFLTAVVPVSDGAAAARYRVSLNCPGGETASTTLRVVEPIRPSRGPATGFGGTAVDGGGIVLLGAGLVLVAAGAGLGVLLLRRRVGT